MFDIMARIDLFELPFGKSPFKTILDTGIDFPPIKRRLGFFIDYTKYMALGGSVSLDFISTHNFDAHINIGPINVTVTFDKPWKYESWSNLPAAQQGTAVTELGEGQLLPDPQ